MGSERSFGLTFAAVFASIGMWPSIFRGELPHYAVTTRSAPLTTAHRSRPLFLPRIGFPARETIAGLGGRASGLHALSWVTPQVYAATRRSMAARCIDGSAPGPSPRPPGRHQQPPNFRRWIKVGGNVSSHEGMFCRSRKSSGSCPAIPPPWDWRRAAPTDAARESTRRTWVPCFHGGCRLWPT